MNKPSQFRFRLYVAGNAPYSLQATSNLRAICSEWLPGRHEIEVIDVLKHQRRALDDGVMLTPLLIKIFPLPARKIVGSLSRREALLEVLDIAG